MGGSVGFLKTLRRIVSELQPSAVYIAWEGGGSQRRRSLYAEYKLNRKPEKLNRFYEDDIPDSDENKQHQIVALLAMLKCVPACQIYVSDCEGDDVIAYLCRSPMKGVPKVIASSDKDLYQLLDADTRIYSLHKKTYVTEPDVLIEFRVRAQNFALAKALCGDTSDNVPGIKGLGFKTVAKMYPFLGTEQEILLQDVIDYAAAHQEESIVHRRVVEQQEDLRRNWRLVFLDGSMLSATQASSVDHLVNTFRPRIDKMGLVKQMVKEGIGDFDVEGFFYAFNCIDGVEYKTNGDK
jgi:DNA polymerase-1